MRDQNGMTKRSFMQAIGAAVPSLRLLLTEPSPASTPGESSSSKFTPADCTPFFTASRSDLERLIKHFARHTDLTGGKCFRGIPFLLGPRSPDKKSYVVLSRRRDAASTDRFEIPASGKAGFVCLAGFCNRDENEVPRPGMDAAEKVGQQLAELVMVYEDSPEFRYPIRRRFEVSAASVPWGHLCFAAVPCRRDIPTKLSDPLDDARGWGDLQIGVRDSNYSGEIVWLSAIANPSPDRALKLLRFESSAEDPLAICGVTLFHGRENPLRYDRLSLYRIILPEPAEEKRWDVGIDLGVVARKYQLPKFDADRWLSSVAAGFGESPELDTGAGYLYVEASASPEATLTLRDRQTGRQYEFDLGLARTGEEVEVRSRGARLQFLERDKVWVHGRVIDAGTHRPTPVRLSILARDGRYIPPYGHRSEVATGWFQDYGADLKQQNTSFAYVDGTFQVELPVGEVYVEITKGFDYTPIRKRLTIRPDQRELDLEISEFAGLRSQGWVSADSHVHFLSPTTAVLQGQAEGLNLINLLAAQWGDLFTNVGDLGQGALASRDGETIVQLGTENRNHILGHLGLLGSPVYPMSTAGPGESYIGDPLWNSLADWADRCRENRGLVMAAHFPYPTGEIAADIVLGKIDAVELRPDAPGEHFNNLRFLDWYRYLNCGYRLPAFGGTDKMDALVPVGATRGYAFLGKEEFTFANWAAAVRKGNTFLSSGPLLLFHADGRAPGSELTLGAGGGRIEVHAEAKSTVPIHRLDIVLNGTVVASREEPAGSRELSLKETIPLSGPGWLAARCASRVPTPELRIAAHTSPIYFAVPGQDLFSAPAAAYMLTLIEGSEMWARNLSTRPDADRMARVTEVFRSARERLHLRLHEHGIASLKN
jgi:hypothetical protein